jgi:hypothetical protein
MEYCSYVNDVGIVILDNLQFMMSVSHSSSSKSFDRFHLMDLAIERFRRYVDEDARPVAEGSTRAPVFELNWIGPIVQVRDGEECARSGGRTPPERARPAAAWNQQHFWYCQSNSGMYWSRSATSEVHKVGTLGCGHSEGDPPPL